MQRMTWLVAVLAAGAVGWTGTLAAQGEGALQGSQAALAKAVMSAGIALARGLEASTTRGQPISGKFELEDGHLQLSVYTAKAGKFSEVIVDYTTGKVEKAEVITDSEDLRAATEQSAVMAKAKLSLRAAVEQALRANAGFRAVSVTPSLKDGRASADIALTKGEEVKTVSVPLR